MQLRRSTLAIHIALALGLGAATVASIAGLERISSISEWLLIPGLVLGWVVASGGVHGSRPMLWIAAIWIGNLFFYGFLWWLVLRWAASRRQGLPPN